MRRSDRLWAGLSTVLVMEPALMRGIKFIGVMTRRKGMTEAQRSIWLLSIPGCAQMNEAMQHILLRLQHIT